MHVQLLLSVETPQEMCDVWMAQADVGEPGSEEHARREGMLKAAVELRARVTAAQDRYSVVVTLLDAAAPPAGPQQACTLYSLSCLALVHSEGVWRGDHRHGVQSVSV